MKKILILTALFLLIASLAACGNGKEASSSGAQTEAPFTKDPALLTAYDHPEQYVTLPTLSEVKVLNSTLDSEVKAHLEQVLTKLGKEDWQSLEKGTPAIRGDKLNIHYTGRAKDPSVKLSEQAIASLSNASQTGGYDLILGSGAFIPGFEEGLIGAKEGETITVDVTFPSNYSEELSNVAVLFEVKVNSIQRVTIVPKSVLTLSVSYTLDGTTENSDLTAFLKAHDVQFDLRDTSVAFDSHFFADAIKEALIGKHHLDSVELSLSMLKEKAEKYGHESVNVKATVTVKKSMVYPDALTDELIDSFTGGAYKTLADYTAYSTDMIKGNLALSAVAKAAKYNDDFPNVLYQNFYQENYNELLYNYASAYQGITVEQLISMLPEEILDHIDQTAKNDTITELRERFLLEALFDHLGLSLSEEEYQKELKELYTLYQTNYYYGLMQYGITSIEQFEDWLGRDYLEVQFLYQKLVPLLKEKIQFVNE